MDQPGDFSTYTLRLVTGALNDAVPSGINPQLSAIAFSFKVEMSPAPSIVLPTALSGGPRTGAGDRLFGEGLCQFSPVMLDRMSALMPQWTERSPADLGSCWSKPWPIPPIN